MIEVLTHLAMAGPGHLRAAPDTPGLKLSPAGRATSAIRTLQCAVAAPHLWVRLGWTDVLWTAWLADPNHLNWFIELDGDRIGVVELVVNPDAIELSAFGLVHEYQGKGLGGSALTLATQTAWEIAARTGTAHRIVLYTSNLDHPHALPNYLSRGFEITGTETRSRADTEPGQLAAPDSTI